MDKKILLASGLTFMLCACGGGSSAGAGPSSGPNPDPTPDPDANAVLKGRFIDSAVSGLAYITNTESGTTDENGESTYRRSDLSHR